MKQEEENTELEVGKGLTRVIQKMTPCGHLYFSCSYRDDDPEKVDFIKIYFSNRFGGCGSSFHEALADGLTFQIRRIRNKHEAIAIVKNLRDHQCNQPPKLSKDRNKSCADAIGKAVMEILGITEDELRGRA